MSDLPRQLLLDLPPATPPRPSQLAFDLAPPPGYAAASFQPSRSNASAGAMIALWPRWPDGALLLTGPAGAGKTHLLHIWAARSGARLIRGGEVAALDHAGLPAGSALAIDNADEIVGPEDRLFHLLNLMREGGRSLLLAARRRPEHWGLKTPDLLSRLRLAPGVAIDAPDEALLRAVLAKLFADRQLAVEGEIADYAATRLPRSLDAARRFVAALDAEGLARGARITRALAGKVLEAMAERDAD